MGGMTTTVMIAIALVLWDARKSGEALKPQKLMWVVIVWSILGLIAQGAPQIATALAIGILITMGFRYLLPTGKAGQTAARTDQGKTGQTGSRSGPSQLPQPKAS